jgi:hypothetical protein
MVIPMTTEAPRATAAGTYTGAAREHRHCGEGHGAREPASRKLRGGEHQAAGGHDHEGFGETDEFEGNGSFGHRPSINARGPDGRQTRAFDRAGINGAGQKKGRRCGGAQ